MSVNGERLRRNMEQLGQVGRQSGGGITRIAFTPDYMAAVSWLKERMEQAGLTVTVDPATNVIGRLDGREPDRIIGMGSHIDTVPQGGMFDGALGVLAALEVAQTLKESGDPLRFPIDVVAFADEEGARFGFGLLGSRSFAGTVDLDLYRRARDRDGVGCPEVLAANGFDLEKLPQARRDLALYQAFLEIHVEQGRILEDEAIPVGIITAIAGSHRYRMHLQGESRHGGTTPMHERKDALWAAAEVVLAVRDQVIASGGYQVGTTGLLEVSPGVANVVPGEASLVFEVRDVDGEAMERTIDAIVARGKESCQRYGIGLKVEPVSRRPPVPMEPGLQALYRRACERLQIASRPIASMGGHDCMVLAPTVPIGMLFLPSQGGYSHSPKEWTDWEHVETGANVLLEAVKELQRG